MRGRISILVLVVLLAACGDGTGGPTVTTTTQAAITTTTAIATTTTTTTTTTTQPPATTTTTSTVPSAAYVWSRAGDEAVFGGSGTQMLVGVAVASLGLVAIGLDDSGGDYDAAVWTSVDGLTWVRVPDDEAALGGPDDQGMFSVVGGGPGLVAVGYVWSGDDGDGAVWTSVDGSAWTRVPHDEAVFGGPFSQLVFDVVVGGPGFVAVGADGMNGGDWNAAVWTSADGLIWTRVPHDEQAFGGPRDQTAQGVAAVSDGLVAVGSAYDPGTARTIAAVWVSDDGLTWERIPGGGQSEGPSPFNEDLTGVVAAGPGLVAFGYEESNSDLNATVWVSVDGHDWTRIDDPEVLGGPGDQRINSVAAVGSVLVAVGSDGPNSADSDAAVWVSEDGLTWTRVPDDESVLGVPGAQARGVAAWHSGVVVVGSDHPTLDDENAAVWIGTIPG
ncbi:MAG: hypothetical protein KJ956_04025 [Actinobacteria bacterium]|nr:hypothetical protein [Actinomycetota bacterium]